MKRLHLFSKELLRQTPKRAPVAGSERGVRLHGHHDTGTLQCDMRRVPVGLYWELDHVSKNAALDKASHQASFVGFNLHDLAWLKVLSLPEQSKDCISWRSGALGAQCDKPFRKGADE